MEQLRNFRCSDEQWQPLELLSELTGITMSEFIRCALPDAGMVQLFMDLRRLEPDVTWQSTFVYGGRRHLQDRYVAAAQAHYVRLGAVKDSVKEVEAAIKRCHKELADTGLADVQLSRAKQDVVFCGYLREALHKAQAEQDGFSLRPVKVGGETKVLVCLNRRILTPR